MFRRRESDAPAVALSLSAFNGADGGGAIEGGAKRRLRCSIVGSERHPYFRNRAIGIWVQDDRVIGHPPQRDAILVFDILPGEAEDGRFQWYGNRRVAAGSPWKLAAVGTAHDGEECIDFPP